MKAINKDFIREIKGTRSRFISILVLVALAVAFLSGLKATAPDMKLTGHNYFEQQKLADVQIMSTVGLTDEDLETIMQNEQVLDAENCYVIDAFASGRNVDKIAKVYSIPEKEINELLVMEGRMPEKMNECVVEEIGLSDLGLSIGDKISIVPQESFEDSLKAVEFTVVGTVRSPIYISRVERGSASIGTGSVGLYMAIPKECFDSDIYTTMFIRLVKPDDMIAFYEDYDNYVDDFIDSIEDLGKNRAKLRYDDLKSALDDAQAELDDAKSKADAELSDAEQKLADADSQIQKGKTEIADADTEIADAEEKINKAESDIIDGEKEIADAKAEIIDGFDKLQEGEEEYKEGLKKWQSGYDEWSKAAATIRSYSQQLAAAEAELNAGQAQLDAFRDGLMSDSTMRTALKVIGVSESSSTDELITAISGHPLIIELIDENLASSGMTFADILDANNRVKQGRSEIAGAGSEIASGNAQLNAKWAELEEGKQELEKAREELDARWIEYNDGLNKFENGKEELEKYKADLEKGKADLEDAKQQLKDARSGLTKGEQDYLDGLAEYEDAKSDADRKIADAQKKIDDARSDLNKITEIKWYIFSRNYNPGYTGLGQDADRMGNLASVYPVFFFLVAALVCLTTMTRMIEEQRIQIGGLKALGYGKLAISRKYIGYGFLPSIAGSLIGLVIGYILFPTMIYTAYQIMYQTPNIELHTYTATSVSCVAAAVACTTLASLAACLNTLRETPARLMVPKTPQAGKRVLLEHVGFIWKRLSFIRKVTIRNLFRYKKRFWMTVIGIGACTALIVSGFGLKYSLTYTMHRQYDELFHYHAQVSLSSGIDKEDKDAVDHFLDSDERVTSYSDLRMASMTASSDARSQSIYLYIMETEDIPKYVDLYDLKTGDVVSVENDGIYIDQKLSELLGVGIGDEIFLDGDNKAYARVGGIFEHYTGHFCYMTPEYFEQVFRDDCEFNGMLMHFTDDSEELCSEIFEDLMKFDGVAGTSRTLDVKDTYLKSMERVDFVVMIIIISAGALALVVLYNLSNINITERMRELATIKVLGFYDNEVSAYVYRENVVLTILGTLLGVVLGHYLHVWLVHSTEIDLMMFGRETDPRSYFIAAGLTILFSVIANLIAHFKMKKIDMVESLKSIE